MTVSGPNSAPAPEPGILASIFGWGPILWILRLGLIIVIVTTVWAFVLFAIRFFRWKHIKQLVGADLPKIHSVGGEIAGVKATVALVEAERTTAEQFALVNARVDDLQQRFHAFVKALEDERSNAGLR